MEKENLHRNQIGKYWKINEVQKIEKKFTWINGFSCTQRYADEKYLITKFVNSSTVLC